MTDPAGAVEAFWVVERRKYLDGFDKTRPVYARDGLRPGDHDYTQEISAAKQFATRELATAWLLDVLRNNEAFEVHEHMMVDRIDVLENKGRPMLIADDPREVLAAVMLQVEADYASAHKEICRLQGIEPATHTWPEWSPQANSLRWFKAIRAKMGIEDHA